MERPVVRQIEEDIVFGRYPPGSHLIEDRLQTRFDLSRHALRSVMGELERGGLVRRIQNRGMQVLEPTPDEIDELYAIRGLLESEAADLTRLPADPDFLADLQDLCDAHAAAASRREMRAVFRANIAFHAAQFAICPNGALRRAIRDYERKVHVVRAAAYGDPGHLERVVTQHREIMCALGRDDTCAYRDVVRRHLPASSEAYRLAWSVRHGTGASE